MQDGRIIGGRFIGIDGATEADMLDGVDPGIVRLVTWLRECGFCTSDSGDGKTKIAQGWTEDNGVLSCPHVVMCVDPGKLVDEAKRLRTLLEVEHGVIVEPTPPEPPDPPQIEALYFVTSDSAMIVLSHVDDSMLRT